MEKKNTCQYWKMITNRAWHNAWDKLGIWGIVVPGFASLLATWLYHRPKSFSEMFGGELVMAVVFFAVLYFIIVSFFALRESSDIYYQQKDNLSLKEFDDINLEYYQYPETDNDKTERLITFQSEGTSKLAFRVNNNGNLSIQERGIKIRDIKYKGETSPNSWVNPPNGVEAKLLKWDEGYIPTNGKIAISPHGYGLLQLAIAQPHPFGAFQFIFLDGVSKTSRLLPGEYRVTLQLYGQVEKDNQLVDLNPIIFDVVFEFSNSRLLFRKVKKKP
jgi:hypothetical protein